MEYSKCKAFGSARRGTKNRRVAYCRLINIFESGCWVERSDTCYAGLRVGTVNRRARLEHFHLLYFSLFEHKNGNE
jgi:hypothetical protein